MADIELVIKIPEGIMEYIKNNSCLSVVYSDEVTRAVANGTPLPKEHGRLIDADYLREKISFVERSNISYIVDNAPTIIEANIQNTLEKEDIGLE